MTKRRREPKHYTIAKWDSFPIKLAWRKNLCEMKGRRWKNGKAPVVALKAKGITCKDCLNHE